MVDGVDVGVGESFNYHTKEEFKKLDPKADVCKTQWHEQDFRSAEMIAIDTHHKLGKEDGTDEGETIFYPVYAIYGDKIVTSEATPQYIARKLIEKHRDKIVLVRRRPYILNGDWCN